MARGRSRASEFIASVVKPAQSADKGIPDKLQQGRECYRRRAWREAYQLLSLADQADPLGAEDLEQLAISAYLTGRDLEELHQEFHLAVGRLRQKPHLVQAFFAQAGLTIERT